MLAMPPINSNASPLGNERSVCPALFVCTDSEIPCFHYGSLLCILLTHSLHLYCRERAHIQKKPLLICSGEGYRLSCGCLKVEDNDLDIGIKAVSSPRQPSPKYNFLCLEDGTRHLHQLRMSLDSPVYDSRSLRWLKAFTYQGKEYQNVVRNFDNHTPGLSSLSNSLS
ncbi:uncharacterized protein ARMOST_17938 [Armillaria ostoyae]|uniref:Uncharacterized protein n=1 Tax=Armillaria ostoyae TaxID=47428 RepID=A0A284S0D6_ARMOS|nr:uncharacterized protein ARMOST_17938 [Armillaria ostoyae]